MFVCVWERERVCERPLCTYLDRLRKSKYAPQLSELHGVNKNKVSVFMHLLPFDGEKCRLNKNKITGFKPLHTILLVIWWWEEQQATWERTWLVPKFSDEIARPRMLKNFCFSEKSCQMQFKSKAQKHEKNLSNEMKFFCNAEDRFSLV